MKTKLIDAIQHAAAEAFKQGHLSSSRFPAIELQAPKTASHGDLATNFCMQMAAVQKMAPRKIAEIILAHLDDPERLITKTEIAGPGFINFFIRPEAWHAVLADIHHKDRRYGESNVGRGSKVQIEFVSANPTGPLHVGHGRGAAVGDSVARILSCCGYEVHKEYYINDSGRQINTLGRSVFMRYQELLGRTVAFPGDCYQGDYIYDIARGIMADKGDALLNQAEDEAVSYCARLAADIILGGIRDDLTAFGVTFDNWFSEQSLYDNNKVQETIEKFRQSGQIYEKDGALWFDTEKYGDEKNRVVVRSNGRTTYFASDIAYHQDKFDRGFETLIDVWGADHHGYIGRLKAAVEAAGHQRDDFKVILVQLVNLLRQGEPVAMSTRAGEFETLQDVVKEVGKDAARFIFLTRHYESPLDFDLELAKQKTNDNPVYYVQYVHARIASILRKAAENGSADVTWGDQAVDRLREDEEIQLIKTLARFPEIVAKSAREREPHRVTYYLMDLAAAFHSFYNKHRVLTDDAQLAQARLLLVMAIKRVIRNGLALLGVSAPDRM